MANEDYVSAVIRHWNDSILLQDNCRYDNAAYHAGYVVECALKGLVRHGGPSPVALGHDLTLLAGGALSLAILLSPSLSRYPTPQAGTLPSLPPAWRPEMRYQRTGSVARGDCQKIILAAQSYLEQVTMALILDGREELRV
jgi:hypothetical protein